VVSLLRLRLRIVLRLVTRLRWPSQPTLMDLSVLLSALKFFSSNHSITKNKRTDKKKADFVGRITTLFI
jgi:hypothetical protein